MNVDKMEQAVSMAEEAVKEIDPIALASNARSIQKTIDEIKLTDYLDAEKVAINFIRRNQKAKIVKAKESLREIKVRSGQLPDPEHNNKFSHSKPEFGVDKINRRLILLQNEIGAWSRDNFGMNDSKIYHGTRLNNLAPLLGVIEECGEMADVQDFSEAKHYEDMFDAFADATIYLCDYAERSGFQLSINPEKCHDILSNMFLDQAGAIELPMTQTIVLQLLGKLVHINLKRHQGIRGWDDSTKYHEANVKFTEDFLGFLLGYSAFHLLDWTEQVWAKVKTRNWKTNPADANKVAETTAS